MNANATYVEPENFSSAGDPLAADIIAEERARHLRELSKLDDFAFALLNAADGDSAAAQSMLDDVVDLLFEDGVLAMWRYRIVQRKIREGL